MEAPQKACRAPVDGPGSTLKMGPPQEEPRKFERLWRCRRNLQQGNVMGYPDGRGALCKKRREVGALKLGGRFTRLVIST